MNILGGRIGWSAGRGKMWQASDELGLGGRHTAVKVDQSLGHSEGLKINHSKMQE